jgi:hypothetical protein
MALLGRGDMQLQRDIEEASGRRLDAIAETELFKPLGLEQTSYVWSDGWQKTADGHGTSSTRGHRFREPWSAFSLHTSAPEYARLVVAMMADEDAEAMFEPAARVDDEPGWGPGFGLRGDGFWHWGDSGDPQATVAGSRGDGRALVCLTNSEHGDSSSAHEATRAAPRLLSLLPDGSGGSAAAHRHRHDHPLCVDGQAADGVAVVHTVLLYDRHIAAFDLTAKDRFGRLHRCRVRR